MINNLKEEEILSLITLLEIVDLSKLRKELSISDYSRLVKLQNSLTKEELNG